MLYDSSNPRRLRQAVAFRPELPTLYSRFGCGADFQSDGNALPKGSCVFWPFSLIAPHSNELNPRCQGKNTMAKSKFERTKPHVNI
ncbi:hypothetical protein, partial [Allomesorhizobium alhagi]|uniref:hypothetical protein n=1 Tax=Allomesorhizobium alhagi TaxID=475067 RepID=UPI001AEBF3A7